MVMLGKLSSHRHRQNVTSFNIIIYFTIITFITSLTIINFYHKKTLMAGYGYGQITSVKSSLCIITHQGHISQVIANDQSVTLQVTSIASRAKNTI